MYRPALSISIGSAIPLAAAAAEAVRHIDLFSGRWWATTILLQTVVLIAYAASSLPKWAKWIDGALLDRLTITQGVLISIIAGNVAWVLAYYYAGSHEAVAWVSAVCASYGGDAYLSRRLELLFGPGRDEPAR